MKEVVGAYEFEALTEKEVREMYGKSLVFNASLATVRNEFVEDSDMDVSGFSTAAKNDVYWIRADGSIQHIKPGKDGTLQYLDNACVGEDILVITRIQSSFPQDPDTSTKHIVFHVLPLEWGILEDYPAIIAEIAKFKIRINSEDDLNFIIRDRDTYGSLSEKVQTMCADIGQRRSGFEY